VVLNEVARIVKGRLYGDKHFKIKNILPPAEAGSHDLAFVFGHAKETDAGAVIAQNRYPKKNSIVVKDARHALYRLLEYVSQTTRRRGISKAAFISANAKIPQSCCVEACAVIKDKVRIGKGTYIGAHCYIDKGVKIGEYCEIHPHCTVYRGTRVGDHVVVNANTVIGKEGFGFIKEQGYKRLRHVGGVIIGDLVEIGSNVSIDRGTVGMTRIGKGTKIDNLVQIAHNVSIGEDCIIMGQSGIAGSSTLGNNVTICGQVGIADHLKIGDNVIVYAKSAVFKPIPARKEYSGIPAREHSAVLRALARLYKR
jgi:UDP-3-O-[3-hydroxymyristoyl] glucosamine N-acyltransferase